MRDKVIKNLSKKYNKKENILLIMIKEAEKEKYSFIQSIELINEFYIINNTCKKSNAISNAIVENFKNFSKCI